VRKGRAGVNPRKPNERIQIPPVRVAKFRPGKTLKESVK
jgi:nucleoid DNA-binding protein